MDMAYAPVRVTSTALLICTLAASCGDDDGGGVTTGLPPDQALAELDAEDSRAACEAVADGLDGVLSADERKRIECTAQALPMSITASGTAQPQVDVAECRDLVRRCVGGESIGGGADAPSFDLDFSRDVDCDADEMRTQFANCSATVAEYENCLNAALAQMDRFFAMIDCDALADLEAGESPADGLDIASLPACEMLADECPQIDLGGGSSEGNPDQETDEPPASGCDNTCIFADDDECDDGGPDSVTPACVLGTDCADCGPR
jgi:hypothetical protein